MRKSLVHATAVLCLAIFGLAASVPAWAQTGQTVQSGPQDGRIPIITEVPIPVPDAGLTPGSEDRFKTAYLTSGRVEDVAQYIGIIYNFLISIVGFVAAIAMVIGGFQYLTSAGDSSKIGAAKGKIANAFIGMILALGAYTILNTINPRLLQLQLPDVRAVSTELSYLPWCEDVVQGDPLNGIAPAEVKPLTASSNCGGIGEFQRGNSKQICAFYGSCRIGKGSVFNLVATCLQKPALTPSSVMEKLKENPNATFAVCTSCAELTEARSAQLGYSGLETTCLGWQATLNAHRAKTDPNQPLWSYCHKAGRYPSCIQADINCRAANDNEDAGSGDCDDDDHDCGCEGYDDSPEPAYAVSDAKFEQSVTVRKYETLDSFPVHLAGVCGWNPCVNYTDDRKPSNSQAYKKGCRGDNGIVYAAQRVVRFGDLGSIDDCRNR